MIVRKKRKATRSIISSSQKFYYSRNDTRWKAISQVEVITMEILSIIDLLALEFFSYNYQW